MAGLSAIAERCFAVAATVAPDPALLPHFYGDGFGSIVDDATDVGFDARKLSQADALAAGHSRPRGCSEQHGPAVESPRDLCLALAPIPLREEARTSMPRPRSPLPLRRQRHSCGWNAAGLAPVVDGWDSSSRQAGPSSPSRLRFDTAQACAGGGSLTASCGGADRGDLEQAATAMEWSVACRAHTAVTACQAVAMHSSALSYIGADTAASKTTSSGHAHRSHVGAPWSTALNTGQPVAPAYQAVAAQWHLAALYTSFLNWCQVVWCATKARRVAYRRCLATLAFCLDAWRSRARHRLRCHRLSLRVRLCVETRRRSTSLRRWTTLCTVVRVGDARCMRQVRGAWRRWVTYVSYVRQARCTSEFNARGSASALLQALLRCWWACARGRVLDPGAGPGRLGGQRRRLETRRLWVRWCRLAAARRDVLGEVANLGHRLSWKYVKLTLIHWSRAAATLRDARANAVRVAKRRPARILLHWQRLMAAHHIARTCASRCLRMLLQGWLSWLVRRRQRHVLLHTAVTRSNMAKVAKAKHAWTAYAAALRHARSICWRYWCGSSGALLQWASSEWHYLCVRRRRARRAHSEVRDLRVAARFQEWYIAAKSLQVFLHLHRGSVVRALRMWNRRARGRRLLKSSACVAKVRTRQCFAVSTLRAWRAASAAVVRERHRSEETLAASSVFTSRLTLGAIRRTFIGWRVTAAGCRHRRHAADAFRLSRRRTMARSGMQAFLYLQCAGARRRGDQRHMERSVVRRRLHTWTRFARMRTWRKKSSSVALDARCAKLERATFALWAGIRQQEEQRRSAMSKCLRTFSRKRSLKSAVVTWWHHAEETAPIRARAAEAEKHVLALRLRLGFSGLVRCTLLRLFWGRARRHLAEKTSQRVQAHLGIWRAFSFARRGARETLAVAHVHLANTGKRAGLRALHNHVTKRRALMLACDSLWRRSDLNAMRTHFAHWSQNVTRARRLRRDLATFESVVVERRIVQKAFEALVLAKAVLAQIRFKSQMLGRQLNARRRRTGIAVLSHNARRCRSIREQVLMGDLHWQAICFKRWRQIACKMRTWRHCSVALRGRLHTLKLQRCLETMLVHANQRHASRVRARTYDCLLAARCRRIICDVVQVWQASAKGLSRERCMMLTAISHRETILLSPVWTEWIKRARLGAVRFQLVEDVAFDKSQRIVAMSFVAWVHCLARWKGMASLHVRICLRWCRSSFRFWQHVVGLDPDLKPVLAQKAAMRAKARKADAFENWAAVLYQKAIWSIPRGEQAIARWRKWSSVRCRTQTASCELRVRLKHQTLSKWWCHARFTRRIGNLSCRTMRREASARAILVELTFKHWSKRLWQRRCERIKQRMAIRDQDDRFSSCVVAAWHAAAVAEAARLSDAVAQVCMRRARFRADSARSALITLHTYASLHGAAKRSSAALQHIRAAVAQQRAFQAFASRARVRQLAKLADAQWVAAAQQSGMKTWRMNLASRRLLRERWKACAALYLKRVSRAWRGQTRKSRSLVEHAEARCQQCCADAAQQILSVWRIWACASRREQELLHTAATSHALGFISKALSAWRCAAVASQRRRNVQVAIVERRAARNRVEAVAHWRSIALHCHRLPRRVVTARLQAAIDDRKRGTTKTGMAAWRSFARNRRNSRQIAQAHVQYRVHAVRADSLRHWRATAQRSQRVRNAARTASLASSQRRRELMLRSVGHWRTYAVQLRPAAGVDAFGDSVLLRFALDLWREVASEMAGRRQEFECGRIRRLCQGCLHALASYAEMRRVKHSTREHCWCIYLESTQRGAIAHWRRMARRGRLGRLVADGVTERQGLSALSHWHQEAASRQHVRFASEELQARRAFGALREFIFLLLHRSQRRKRRREVDAACEERAKELIQVVLHGWRTHTAERLCTRRLIHEFRRRREVSSVRRGLCWWSRRACTGSRVKWLSRAAIVHRTAHLLSSTLASWLESVHWGSHGERMASCFQIRKAALSTKRCLHELSHFLLARRAARAHWMSSMRRVSMQRAVNAWCRYVDSRRGKRQTAMDDAKACAAAACQRAICAWRNWARHQRLLKEESAHRSSPSSSRWAADATRCVFDAWSGYSQMPGSGWEVSSTAALRLIACSRSRALDRWHDVATYRRRNRLLMQCSADRFSYQLLQSVVVAWHGRASLRRAAAQCERESAANFIRRVLATVLLSWSLLVATLQQTRAASQDAGWRRTALCVMDSWRLVAKSQASVLQALHAKAIQRLRSLSARRGLHQWLARSVANQLRTVLEQEALQSWTKRRLTWTFAQWREIMKDSLSKDTDVEEADI